MIICWVWVGPEIIYIGFSPIQTVIESEKAPILISHCLMSSFDLSEPQHYRGSKSFRCRYWYVQGEITEYNFLLRNNHVSFSDCILGSKKWILYFMLKAYCQNGFSKRLFSWSSSHHLLNNKWENNNKKCWIGTADFFDVHGSGKRESNPFEQKSEIYMNK